MEKCCYELEHSLERIVTLPKCCQEDCKQPWFRCNQLNIVEGSICHTDRSEQTEEGVEIAHDFRHEALVAVADAEVAETAAAHGAGHGGVADQADDRDRQALPR